MELPAILKYVNKNYILDTEVKRYIETHYRRPRRPLFASAPYLVLY